MHLCSPFNWLYKIFFSGIVGASEWKKFQLLSPWFIPTTVRPSLQHEEHLQDLFCTNNVLETVSPELIIYFKATKNSVKNLFIQTEVTLSSPHPNPTSPRDLRLFGVSGIAHTAHVVCKQGNHWATAVCVTTRCHSSRSCRPGCIRPCTGQSSNSKHPTHIPATRLKTRPPKVFQKPLLISTDYSPVVPYALWYFWKGFEL